MIDLAPLHLETVKRILAEYVPACEVRAFGSRAAWTAKDYSDLDLAVVGAQPLAPDTLRRMKEAFEESDLPFRVEVLDWHAISPSFRKVIEKKFEVVQKGEKKSRGMADKWPITRVGDLADSISETHGFGKEHLVFLNTSDILLGKILHHSYSAVKNYPGQAKKSIRKDDILFSEIRPANGRYAYVNIEADDYVVSTKLMVIRAKDGHILPKFLYHYLTSQKIVGWLQHLAESRSGTFPQITFDQVAELELLLPSKANQTAIVSFVDALDDKIELNRKMNETLEALARALFKSWFVDFDPVREKAAGRKPKGMDAATAALFPASFQDSPLGKIPKGWRVVTIAELSEINTWTLSKEDALDRIEYVEISEVVRGNIGTIQVFQRGGEPSRARRRLRHGDTVLSTVRPERESYFLCLNPSPNLIASTGFAVLTPTKAPWSLVHTILTQSEVFEYLGQQADGGAYPAVRPDVIGQRQSPWPDKSTVVELFHHICAPLYERAEHNRLESRTLVIIRNALLPKLLSGELRVADAEQFVGKCA